MAEKKSTNEQKPTITEGILATPGTAPTSNLRVTITTTTVPERRAGQPVDPPPNPERVTAPVVNHTMLDDVEMLRRGILNIHGEEVVPSNQESSQNNKPATDVTTPSSNKN